MKYSDTTAIVQVIGCIYQNNNLLDNSNYFFHEEDFTEDFHKIIFGSIYNLYQTGAKEINANTIEDYLENKPSSYAIFKNGKGVEYLQKITENIQLSTFDYYYQRMKKMTLLRMYDNAGMDLKWLYDIDNILDTKKKQVQEEWLDSSSLEVIADVIDKKITDIRLKYVDDTNTDFIQNGENIDKLIINLQQHPELGYPLYGPLVNTVTRGARLKKFYVRSGATGTGKTRAMIADACNIAFDKLYNSDTRTWENNGTKEPTLFIATEQDIDEVQTMVLAFLSDVPEDHIIYNEYYAGELDRVLYAAELMKESPLYIKKMPDFSLKDIENCIKYSIMEWDVKYIFFDYLHSSMKILGEVTSKAGVKGLREDNVLFMISVRLKDLCNEYGVFIMTATQLNAGYQDSDTPDQNLLRGAKSIADKIDLGMIILKVTAEDKEVLKSIIAKYNIEMPELKISVYKNRRGQYKDLLLWCRAKQSTCRITPLFATDYQYKIIEMQDLKINIVEKEESIF